MLNKKEQYICNWCMKRIRVNVSFYSLDKEQDKDFHVKCFYKMMKLGNLQLGYEKECDREEQIKENNKHENWCP